MPSYSSPWQRPDRATHNHTLSDLLSSYAPPDRSRYLNREVATREREAEFRREGRFIPGTDLLFGTKLDGEELPPLYEPPKRETRDHWDNVIDSVAEHYKLRTEGEKVLWNGREIAAGVAEEIKAYWEVHAVKREKMRVQEEKRLRALAKATIKSVVSEWKRAVHVSLKLVNVINAGLPTHTSPSAYPRARASTGRGGGAEERSRAPRGSSRPVRSTSVFPEGSSSTEGSFKRCE